MIAQEQAISNSDFSRLRNLIQDKAGINLNADKKTMVELRIKRRLKSLNLDSYTEYCEYLFGHRGQQDELIHLIDVVTTNKTDFYREPRHFEYLVKTAVPDILSRNRTDRPLVVWSAGCSTGEEPYTLAIVLSEYALANPGFRFRIMATDICTTVLEKAAHGVFTAEVVKPVPQELQRKYFMRSRDAGSDHMRVVPELRKLIDFRRLNFMDSSYGLSEKVDMFFCRNVIIYFDRPTQEAILQKLTSNLLPGGYVFVGHSETLNGMDLPLVPVAPALYRRIDA
jgi:chemotaxis protein methyltransferase CheR